MLVIVQTQSLVELLSKYAVSPAPGTDAPVEPPEVVLQLAVLLLALAAQPIGARLPVVQRVHQFQVRGIQHTSIVIQPATVSGLSQA